LEAYTEQEEISVQWAALSARASSAPLTWSMFHEISMTSSQSVPRTSS
jgi:hypothetical protein